MGTDVGTPGNHSGDMQELDVMVSECGFTPQEAIWWATLARPGFDLFNGESLNSKGRPPMKLLVFQHISCEHPGILRRFLVEDDISCDTVEFDRGDRIPRLDDYDMLWVMGGPMDVWDIEDYPWLVAEKRAIRCWVRELGRPYLGLCLGHQLLADALGGTCGPQRPPEIGILEVDLTAAGKADAVFGRLPHRFKALQWHSVRVAQAPDDAVILASSSVCPNQAMRIGRNTYSMQYHVELEPETIPNWGRVPAYEAALAQARGPGALAALAWEAEPLMDDFAVDARAVYRGFMAAARAVTV